ncbi:hypothetical protein PHMEG_00036614 [Phytophthora megakarya]|uniref:Uncharacterized protein n=1 Tax=Phytophthora megakarya TaxID=4795 RepID=A0A225ULE0_9STRA|nr:hypothetical protein PHMEG_00036614 [Phytophthora megakarya]
MYNYHDSWCFRRAVVIAHDHVELGIKWVKQEICRRCSATFIYYSKIDWCKWPVARTNNPLERYNRELNNRILTHPSMTTFVSAIKTLLAEYVGRLAYIPRGCARRMPREAIQLPVPIEIPPDIEDDSDSDEPAALEQASDDSLGEEQPPWKSH